MVIVGIYLTNRYLRKTISFLVEVMFECSFSPHHRRVVDPRTGATALHIAAAKGYSEVLELLLKLPDVEVDATDVDGWTPLHAAAHWAKEKPLRLLAAAGASFDTITLTVSAPFSWVFTDFSSTRSFVCCILTYRSLIHPTICLIHSSCSDLTCRINQFTM